MEDLKQLGVDLSDVSFAPKTNIVCIMRSGAKIHIVTPLTVSDFASLWNSRKRRIKIITGKDGFATIDKKRVDFYHVCPIEN